LRPLREPIRSQELKQLHHGIITQDWQCHGWGDAAQISTLFHDTHCSGQELTLARLVTAYWIAFGEHGPRALPPADEGKKVFFYTLMGVGASLVLFAGIRMMGKPAPSTMTREWQEASNEYLKVRRLSCPRLPASLAVLALLT
jgi:hypothetical protein